MEDLYKVAIDTSTIFSETDTAGTILNVNDGYCKASGYSSLSARITVLSNPNTTPLLSTTASGSPSPSD
ncbi:nucleotide cyclase [Penicillium soppii]|uniref:nucleotide cyclase n=1 Tax=Penicillium soppii TaxID=69789 RepID=UPI0025481DE7|nr:nucleotide cyclase [Penicillium soppii]KAJ5861289.1 nucleotide cyclase [Penicillium soppii]